MKFLSISSKKIASVLLIAVSFSTVGCWDREVIKQNEKENDLALAPSLKKAKTITVDQNVSGSISKCGNISLTYYFVNDEGYEQEGGSASFADKSVALTPPNDPEDAFSIYFKVDQELSTLKVPMGSFEDFDDFTSQVNNGCYFTIAGTSDCFSHVDIEGRKTGFACDSKK